MNGTRPENARPVSRDDLVVRHVVRPDDERDHLDGYANAMCWCDPVVTSRAIDEEMGAWD